MWARDRKTFSIRMKVPNMSLDRIGRLKDMFDSIAVEVFGKKMVNRTLVKPVRCEKKCKFILELREEPYDLVFMDIIIMNIADASISLSCFKTDFPVYNDSKRQARMCFALYMDRNKEEMTKIKKEYAEVL
jgi:hypothetical protein